MSQVKAPETESGHAMSLSLEAFVFSEKNKRTGKFWGSACVEKKKKKKVESYFLCW
jgi:hypothetical protein